MKICPITYNNIPDDIRYHLQGLKKLSPKLDELLDFPFSADKQREEAIARVTKLSIQGVQPKLSVRFDLKSKTFNMSDKGGNYILKPQSNLFNELPENEDLTMKLAAQCGIDLPFHGLIYCADESLSYFIKRFDRITKNRKLPLEDFAQLAGKTRDTKYDFSMEKVIKILDKFTTFPMIEKTKLFRRTLFSFLIGNEDMHLKNFSLISQDGKHELSPAYDLVNSTLAMPNATEEIALPLNGKKNQLTKKDFIDYFAFNKLNLQSKIIQKIVQDFQNSVPIWHDLIQRSFLSKEGKINYAEILNNRIKRIF